MHYMSTLCYVCDNVSYINHIIALHGKRLTIRTYIDEIDKSVEEIDEAVT